MSHSIGAIQFKSDKKILFYEYDGTSDVVIPSLWETQEEVSEHWRKYDGPKECIRNKFFPNVEGHNHEDVEIISTYGFGFHWQGKACRECMVITDGLLLMDIDTTDDYPSWSPWQREKWMNDEKKRS